MTAQALRQTLLAMRKDVRKARRSRLAGAPADAHADQSTLSGEDAAWFSAVLFKLVAAFGVDLSFEEAVRQAHASFAQALPAPAADANCDELVNRLAPHAISLNETAFGWLYQIFCEQSRVASQKAFQQSNKQCSVNERIAFTQLYTPEWVSAYLVERCLAPPHPGKNKNDLTLIDPACGAGNILLCALEFLAGMRGQQGEDNPFGKAASCIYGADIDPVALFVTNVSILCRVKRAGGKLLGCTNLIAVGDEVLGSLERSHAGQHILNNQYSAVVTNPPYIGRKLLDRQLKEQLKAAYPLARHDISAAFLLRGLELLQADGTIGLITQAAQFVLPSFAPMRRQLLENHHVDFFVECGAGAFPLQTGEKVNSALVVVSKQPSPENSTFIDLSQATEKDVALYGASRQTANCDQRQFLQNSGCAFNYKAPAFLRRLPEVSATLADLADVRQGLATTNNARFVKQWWQVPPDEIGSRWIPYVKGAGSERWWAPIDTVVLWANAGQDIKQAVRDAYPYLKGKTAWVVKNESHYFRPGLVFSFVNTRQFCARLLPQGCIFDVAASAIFPNDDPYFMLAFLNSAFCALQANILNPTINFQVGDLKKLCVPRFNPETKEKLAQLGRTCVEIKEQITQTSGTICGAGARHLSSERGRQSPERSLEHWLDSCSRKIEQLSQVERQVDAIVLTGVCEALQLNANDSAELSELCRQQQEKRRAPAIFPSTPADLESLRTRFCASAP